MEKIYLIIIILMISLTFVKINAQNVTDNVTDNDTNITNVTTNITYEPLTDEDFNQIIDKLIENQKENIDLFSELRNRSISHNITNYYGYVTISDMAFKEWLMGQANEEMIDRYKLRLDEQDLKYDDLKENYRDLDDRYNRLLILNENLTMKMDQQGNEFISKIDQLTYVIYIFAGILVVAIILVLIKGVIHVA